MRRLGLNYGSLVQVKPDSIALEDAG